MPYRIGAQGPQSPAGAQGPTLQSGAMWGPQGPVAGKRPPFVVNNSNFNMTGNTTLFLEFGNAAGQTFAVFVERPLPDQNDLLATLPDDIVRIVNLVDFRPQQGVFRTLAGGSQTPYHVVETTGNTLLGYLKATNKAGDVSAPSYTQPEVGL